jgi:ankyrin repeat protein
MDRLASVIHRTKHLAMRKSRKKIREGMIIYRMYSGEKKAEPVQTTPAVFLDQASPNGYSKLHFAILFNDIDLFNTELAKEGATVNQANAHGHTLLHDAIIFGREEMVQKLMSFPEIDISVQTNQKSLLNLSIQYRQENIAKMLLNRGVEIWGSGFYEAVETNQREVVKAMIARGMTPHEINYAVLPRLERPLHLAIYRRDKEMITLLLKNGANPKAQAMEKVGSPLACLADIRDAEFLKFMISILPDLDGADEDKMTLLQHATLKGNAELVALLSQTSN